MKYFELTIDKNYKIVDALIPSLGDFLSTDPKDIIDLIPLNNGTISRDNKTEFISEIDDTLLYYDLIKAELYSCIDNKAEKAPDNIDVVDNTNSFTEIVDFDSDFEKFKSAYLDNFVITKKENTCYLRVVDSTKISCLDINDKGIIVIHFNNDSIFNFDIFPSTRTNRTIYYIDIDNSAVEKNPNNYVNRMMYIISSLTSSINELFTAACIYNGYYRVIPLIIFDQYIYRVSKSYDHSISVSDGILHKLAKNKFNIPNFLKYYDGVFSTSPCNIIKFLSEQEKIIHQYPVPIISIKYHNDSDIKELVKILHKAMECAIIYKEDLYDDGNCAITCQLDKEEICAIFIFYHDDDDNNIKEFARSISDYSEIDLSMSEDHNSLILRNDEYIDTINLDEFAPYKLLKFAPKIKSKFDADHKNGIPETIEDYRQHPMGNPVPMIVDEPMRNSFVHKNK